MSEILDDYNDGQSIEKTRHGCVSGCLWFGVVASALSVVFYIFGGDAMTTLAEQAGQESFPDAMIYIGAITAAIGLFGYYLILKWKKNGFFIVLGLSAISGVATYFIMGDITSLAASFIGPLILYAILQIQKDGVSAWDHLE